MISLTQSDYLNYKENEDFTKNLEKNENIIFSSIVTKYNDYDKKQERVMLITTKFLYNLKNKKTIQRKIKLSDIIGITFSLVANEFIIHVPIEYDYRFMAEKKDEICYTLVNITTQYQKSPCLLMWLKEEEILKNYATTKKLKKKNQNTIPIEVPIQLRKEDIELILHNSHAITSFPKLMKPEIILYYNKRKVNEFADFFFVDSLGTTTFGTQALLIGHKSTKKLMVLKFVPKKYINESIQDEKITYEKNPFLCRLEYIFQSSSYTYFITKFEKYGTLLEKIQSSPKKCLAETQIKFYCICLIAGLTTLHNQRIIYRDLKSENIVFGKDGYPKFTDFGIGHYAKKPGLANLYIRAPNYFSPEIINGSQYTNSSDWWSLGVIIFEMLYGILPFEGENLNAVYDNIMSVSYFFPKEPQVSQEAKDFIFLLLNKDKNARLGAKDGINEFKSHPWLAQENWEAILSKQKYILSSITEKPKSNSAGRKRSITFSSMGESFSLETEIKLPTIWDQSLVNEKKQK